jgi:hypothetical protein
MKLTVKENSGDIWSQELGKGGKYEWGVDKLIN